ncbi:biopolymer transporter ExbD [Sphingomonas sp. RB3P16]|uniref:ExbD/TolR family protein n=1 Tax=Parasphingomonas frigoris TaxID=3096163 RepID=UPI002FC69C22
MRARSLSPAFADHGQPMATMNMTPLIDVLLVLLVMMIITVPMITNTVPLDLPQPAPIPPRDHVFHRLDLRADGGLAWDGTAIADSALPAHLAALRRDPAADLQIAADAAARYDRFDHTLATIKRAGITRLGFIGNDRFAHFDAE